MKTNDGAVTGSKLPPNTYLDGSVLRVGVSPEQKKEALVASFAELDGSKERALVASMRDDEVYRDLEHAAIVAAWLDDADQERLELDAELLSWVADNEAAITAASQAFSGPRISENYRVFNKHGREVAPQALVASGGPTPGTYLRTAAFFSAFDKRAAWQRRMALLNRPEGED